MNKKIIEILKKKKDYFSGQELSQALGSSRTAVWKHIEQLRADGYDIDAVSRKGYRLISAPDKFFPMEIQNGLGTKTFGKTIFYDETVKSTMDEAMRLGLKGEPQGTVVCADAQTQGRGRLGRRWESLKGKGIYCSIILRPCVPVSEASQLTLVFAVSVCQALREQNKLNAQIKWPNDLLVNGKKISGILTEMNAEMDRIHFIVVGIGVNVNEQKKELLRNATSVYCETKKKSSRVCLLKEILRKSEKNYFLFQDQGLSPIREQWRQLSATLHQQVRIIDGNHTAEGKALDIDEDGSLLIQTNNGQIIKKISGEVVHLRAGLK